MSESLNIVSCNENKSKSQPTCLAYRSEPLISVRHDLTVNDFERFVKTLEILKVRVSSLFPRLALTITRLLMVSSIAATVEYWRVLICFGLPCKFEDEDESTSIILNPGRMCLV